MLEYEILAFAFSVFPGSLHLSLIPNVAPAATLNLGLVNYYG